LEQRMMKVVSGDNRSIRRAKL